MGDSQPKSKHKQGIFTERSTKPSTLARKQKNRAANEERARQNAAYVAEMGYAPRFHEYLPAKNNDGTPKVRVVGKGDDQVRIPIYKKPKRMRNAKLIRLELRAQTRQVLAATETGEIS